MLSKSKSNRSQECADEAHDDDDYGDMQPLSERHDDDDSDSDDEDDEEDGVWNYMTRTWSDVVQKGACTSVSKPAIVSDDEASDDEAGGTKPMAVKKTVKAPAKL